MFEKMKLTLKNSTNIIKKITYIHRPIYRTILMWFKHISELIMKSNLKWFWKNVSNEN